MNEIFKLLILFQIKHFLADNPLQTEYMLCKTKKKNWVMPLLAHASTHGLGTYVIVAMFNHDLSWICTIDIAIHFVLDRIRASPKRLNRYNYTQKQYWWVLGIDQMAHHFTHYLLIWMIVR